MAEKPFPAANGKRDFDKKLDPGRRAWYKQPRETARAYEAFTTFLMLGPTRNLGDTAAALKKSYPMMARWSKQWHWFMRAGAYEEHYMLLRLESAEAERDTMYIKQREIASSALRIVEAKLNGIARMIKMDEEAVLIEDKIRMEALVRLMDTAGKMERMAVEGRIVAHERSAEEQEKLEERYAEELATFTKDFMNKLSLSPEQEDEAKKALADLLVADKKSVTA